MGDELDVKVGRRKHDPDSRYYKVGGNTARRIDQFNSPTQQVLGAEDILPLEVTNNLNKAKRWDTVPEHLLKAGFTECKPTQAGEKLSGHEGKRDRLKERWFKSSDGKLVRVTGRMETDRDRSMGVHTASCQRQSRSYYVKHCLPKVSRARKKTVPKEDYRLLELAPLSPMMPSSEVKIPFENPLIDYIETELVKVEWCIPDEDGDGDGDGDEDEDEDVSECVVS